MTRAAPRIATIPPGVDFLATLADQIVSGTLLPGLAYSTENPLSLAGATVFVPTRRAARVLRSELTDCIGKGSAILPVIRPLGETDDDAGFFDTAEPETLTLDPPIPQIAATLRLADLVLAWKQALPQAVRDHLEGMPLVAPANPADAIWLGSALFDLIQAVETEEGDFAGLETVIDADLQQWWQLTSEFLKIARQFWPSLLEEIHRSSPARHHNAMIDVFTRGLAVSAANRPVIVAGSTGTRPSTARLIAMVAHLPQGAVVLPGLDQVMRPQHWQALARAAANQQSEDGRILVDVAIRSHPQYGLLHLLQSCGLEADRIGDIPEIGQLSSELAIRRRMVSSALLPASSTEAWGEPGFLPAPTVIGPGFDHVSLIEATNEREEASALAAAMRRALEPRPGLPEPTAALVTPDRNLARRVVTELGRYGIQANDSGGAPLAASLQGGLARLAVQLAFAPGDAVAITALIKHPLARFGLTRARASACAGLVERLALRGGSGAVDIGALDSLVTLREPARHDRHAPQWRARISDRQADEAREFARRATEALAPLTSMEADRTGQEASTRFTIGRLAALTAEALERICVDETGALDLLWGDEAGADLADLLLETRDSGSMLEMTGPEWVGALDALMAGRMVKPRAGGHPRAFIWGALEARLQHVDTLLMGALNEGVWPQAGQEDPFLSRAMKAAIGLEPPERRIGQAAHDFQMAMGAPEVVLSRSFRSGKAPTVASRWLQRLLAVIGPAPSDALRARGQMLLTHARTLDQGPPAPAALRPEPHPAAELQPNSYSFSEVGKLRRDPYAIYARRILHLDPLEDLRSDPGPRERGTLYHAILEAFVSSTEPDARTLETLSRITTEHFAKAGLPDAAALVWRMRFDKAARTIVDWESENAADVVRSLVEARAVLDMPEAGIRLTGMADRIDLRRDGSVWIIDYKTGGSPSRKEARILLDPQLALEAHALINGGFADTGKRPVSGLFYQRLTGKEPFAERIDTDPEKPGRDEVLSPADLAAKAAVEFSRLVVMLRSGQRGFLSRAIPQSARDFGGEYDHLARVAEWQTAVDAEGGDSDE
ncbi:double-strand break repair protein AddB [Hoeflea sp. YIM 152468]|uniref:double-strand break repair protein AddB n=1 Tax=Hoeflea sp. YIM 152468 TaxID=3031759 RepID=UPI0023D9ADF6|nr:double-strand break repair protein AddB [Hoeflea sp. YIM 152468]MDF1610461.1 double-strand break repair protein AddB [Hoeflea sp. YIM 152468]